VRVRRDEVEASELFALGNGGDGLDMVSRGRRRRRKIRTAAMVMLCCGEMAGCVRPRSRLSLTRDDSSSLLPCTDAPFTHSRCLATLAQSKRVGSIQNHNILHSNHLH
jgi:hypothetical protein